MKKKCIFYKKKQTLVEYDKSKKIKILIKIEILAKPPN